MHKERRRLWAVIVILAWIGMVMACGGESPTTQKSSQRFEDGHISVRNDTDKGPVTVTFLTPDNKSIVTVIQPGETQIVSGGGVISGGSKVRVNVKGRSQSNQTTSMDIEVKVDGNMIVRVMDIRSGQVDYEITSG